MADPLLHLSILSLLTVTYFACWLFEKAWKNGYQWYIPLAAAVLVFGFMEAAAWPLWYLLTR